MRPDAEHRMDRDVLRSLRATSGAARENLAWLHASMAPIFFHTMREEPEAVAALCLHLRDLSRNRHLVLADREKEMMLARLSVPGSLYETLRFLGPREISYAEIAHSYSNVPGADKELEFQRYEFDRKAESEISVSEDPGIPDRIRRGIFASLRSFSPPSLLRPGRTCCACCGATTPDTSASPRRNAWPGSCGSFTRRKAAWGSTSTCRKPTRGEAREPGRAASSSPSGTRRRRTTCSR